MRKRGSDASVLAVQKWFRESVTYEGEPYAIDYEWVRGGGEAARWEEIYFDR